MWISRLKRADTYQTAAELNNTEQAAKKEEFKKERNSWKADLDEHKTRVSQWQEQCDKLHGFIKEQASTHSEELDAQLDPESGGWGNYSRDFTDVQTVPVAGPKHGNWLCERPASAGTWFSILRHGT